MDYKTPFVLGILFVVSVMGYFSLGLMYPGSDANGYYLQSKMILDGCLPYRDETFVQMPLMVYPTALAFMVLGSSVWVGNLVELSFAAATLILVLLVGERLSRYGGVLACIFLLAFSMGFHTYSHVSYGLFMSCALLLASFYFRMLGKDAFSGFFAAASLLVRLNNLPFVLVLMLTGLRRPRFWLGAAATLPVWLLLVLQPNFIDDTVLMHLYSPSPSFERRMMELHRYWDMDGILVLLGLFGVASTVYSAIKRKAFESGLPDNILLISVILYLVMVLSSPKVFSYYFILAAPYVSILSSYRLVESIPPNRRLSLIALVAVFGLIYSLGSLGQIYVNHSPSVVGGAVKAAVAGIVRMDGEKVLGIAVPEISDILLKTNKTPVCGLLGAPNYFYVSYFRSDGLEDAVLRRLNEADIVVLEPNVLNDFSRRGIGLVRVVEELGDRGFYPAMLATDGGTFQAVVWGRVPPYGVTYQKPGGSVLRNLSERDIRLVDGVYRVKESVSAQVVASSDAYVPPILMDGTYLAGDPVFWPVKVGDSRSMGCCGFVTRSWLGSDDHGILEYVFITFRGDEISSVGRVSYDTSSNSTVRFELYGKSSPPGQEVIGPTYVQDTVGQV